MALDRTCVRCGANPALGWSLIDGRFYCHDKARSCYSEELLQRAGLVVQSD